MHSSPEILNELRSISPLLAEMEKKDTFTVPDGYFSSLAEKLKLNAVLSTKVNGSTLTIPENYFQNLSTAVLEKIQSTEDDPQQELRKLSPMLYAVQNENVFSVSKDYFKNLPGYILSTITGEQQAKVVALKKKTLWSYAAAVVAGAIGISSLFLLTKSNTPAGVQESKTVASSYVNTASQFKNEQQIKNAVAALPADEIVNYLEATGSDLDNEALTANIEEKELPSKIDYLSDEQALETYLNKINANENQN